MRPQPVLAVVALIFAVPPSYGQHLPGYCVESAPARRALARYSYEGHFPDLQATDWALIVAKPPHLPSQAVRRFTVEPAGEEVRDETALKQPLIRLVLRPRT